MENGEDHSAGLLAEIVFLIHGTGAGIADEAAPRWWQSDSTFARKLAEAIGKQRVLGPRFLWGQGGANSELARREGGAKLFQDLDVLEQSNSPYHLVGHSHGGSVIWHALVQSARQGKRLKGLKTWTTIGTPFLEFGPDPVALWQPAGLAATTATLALLGSSISTFFAQRAVIFFEGSLSAVVAVATLGLLLAFLWLYFLFRIVLLVRQFSAARATRAAERQAADWYGDQWLCLWHDKDEPIAGLQASLSEPPELIPRMARPPRSLPLRVLLAPYDWLAALFGDAFAWTAIMAKLQGSDVIGNVMLSAGPAPSALAPGWPSLFPSLATLLKSSADARAGASAGRLRDALVAAAKDSSGAAALTEIAKIIGWDELIHTSYFGAQGLGELIARSIANGPLPAGVPADFKRLPSAWGANRRYRERSFRLAAASAALVGVLSLLLGVSFNATYGSSIEPLTDAFQVSTIAEVYDKRRILSAADGPMSGKLLFRLYSAGALPAGNSKKPFAHDLSRRVFGAVQGMPDEEQRFAALQVFFFYLGAQGRDRDLADLFSDMHVALDETRDDKFEAVLAISAELGYVAAGKPPTARVLSIGDKIMQVADLDRSSEVLLPYLIRRNRMNEAKDLTHKLLLGSDKSQSNCYRRLFRLVVIWASQGEEAEAVSIARQCDNEKDQYHLTLEAVAALARRGGDGDVGKAAALLRATEDKNPLLSSAAGWHIPGIATLLVRQNRPADARNYILNGFKDIVADKVTGGFDGMPEVLSVADEMARRGFSEDSRAILAQVIKSKPDR